MFIKLFIILPVLLIILFFLLKKYGVFRKQEDEIFVIQMIYDKENFQHFRNVLNYYNDGNFFHIVTMDQNNKLQESVINNNKIYKYYLFKVEQK